MKKIKLCVAALLIAVNSYSENGYNVPPDISIIQEINNRIHEIVDAIRMDMFYGRITQDNGMYYINEVMTIKKRNEDLISELSNKKQVAQEDYIDSIDCENCDEID
tara:strand:- start:204 stop:521 length:318 start_codon:yes stop_codon:yes gene_type:complete